jgi:hypothetical protein
MKKIGIVMVAGLLLACPMGNQPKPDCLVAHGEWVLKYKLTSAPDATSTCDDFHGELVGIQKYLNKDDQYEVYIKLGQLMDWADSFNDPAIMARGLMPSKAPDANNLCNVPTLTEASETTNSAGIRYQFSNVQFYVTSQVQGTQMKGTLSYQDGSCTTPATYEVTGVYPVVWCEEGPLHGDYTSPRDIDEAWCTQTNNLFVNNSIHPDVKAVCNPNIYPTYWWADVSTTPQAGWCVIDEFPSFGVDAQGRSKKLY